MDILFVLLLLVNAVSNATQSVIAPFFPPLAQQMGVNVEMIGLILTANPISAFITSLVLAKILNQVSNTYTKYKHNRIQILVSGLVIQVIGLIMFGFVNHINDYNVFIAVTISSRLIQGIGVSAQAVPAHSFIPLLYPHKIEKKMSLLELSTGLGYIAGRLLGSLIYQLGGFSAPFLFFTFVMILCIPLIYKYLKSQMKTSENDNSSTTIHPEFKIDDSGLTSAEGSIDTIQGLQTALSLRRTFSSWSIVLTFLVTILSTFSYNYFEPILALFLIENYNASQDLTGYLMSVVTISYIAGCLVMGHLMFAKKQLILAGVLVSAISFLFQGPDHEFTKLDPNIYIVLSAQGMLGLGCAMIFIPSLPLMYETLLNMYPLEQENVGITASILFTIAASSGDLFGPFAGGLMTQYFGYIRGCSYTVIKTILMQIQSNMVINIEKMKNRYYFILHSCILFFHIFYNKFLNFIKM